MSIRPESTLLLCGIALILAATLYPFDFSFNEPINFSEKFKLSSSIQARGNDLIIGVDAAFGQAFRGKIDELRIYRNALTPAQIALEARQTSEGQREAPSALPDNGAGGSPDTLVAASYSFNQDSGAVVKDDSGNGNDGRIISGKEGIVEGSRGALNFNGSGQYVRVPNSPSIDINGRSMTISMRIAMGDSSEDGVIVAKPWNWGHMEYPYYQYGVEFGGRTKSVNFYFADTNKTMRGPFRLKTPSGAWVHVAFVYDGAVRGYVDGREQLVSDIGNPWDLRDIMGNLLLFLPFGFGLAAVSRSKGVSLVKAILLILVVGTALSFCVEILQCWLPTRDPSFIDVATNSVSTILGAVLCFGWNRRIGERICRALI